MPAPFVEGSECAISFFNIEHWFREMNLNIDIGDRVIPVLEIPDGFRIDDIFDASIDFVAYHGTETGQGTIQDLITHAINRVAPDDFSWLTTDVVPVSFLPAAFFGKFPKSTWRISSIRTGAAGAREQLVATVTIKPKYAIYVP